MSARRGHGHHRGNGSYNPPQPALDSETRNTLRDLFLVSGMPERMEQETGISKGRIGKILDNEEMTLAPGDSRALVTALNRLPSPSKAMNNAAQQPREIGNPSPNAGESLPSDMISLIPSMPEPVRPPSAIAKQLNKLRQEGKLVLVAS